MSFSLKDRVVIVTGANSGMGRATGIFLAKQGASIALGDINLSASASTIDEIKQQSGHGDDKISFEKLDVSSMDSAKEFVEKTVKKFGRLDGLVNSAGIAPDQPFFGDYTLEMYLKVISINLTGTWIMDQVCLNTFLAQTKEGKPTPEGGYSVVNIGSVVAQTGYPSGAAYCVSKHGVLGLTRTIAKEYAKQGVRANCVCPGFTETPLLHDMIGTPDQVQAMTNIVCPMGRVAEPPEIATMISYLLSPAASYVNGQALAVDGGWLA